MSPPDPLDKIALAIATYPRPYYVTLDKGGRYVIRDRRAAIAPETYGGNVDPVWHDAQFRYPDREKAMQDAENLNRANNLPSDL